LNKEAFLSPASKVRSKIMQSYPNPANYFDTAGYSDFMGTTVPLVSSGKDRHSDPIRDSDRPSSRHGLRSHSPTQGSALDTLALLESPVYNSRKPDYSALPSFTVHPHSGVVYVMKVTTYKLMS
jgi:hypothetical protein